MTIFYSYVLLERESMLIMQPLYRIRKLANCVKVNQKFHNILRYKKQKLAISLQG